MHQRAAQIELQRCKGLVPRVGLVEVREPREGRVGQRVLGPGARLGQQLERAVAQRPVLLAGHAHVQREVLEQSAVQVQRVVTALAAETHGQVVHSAKCIEDVAVVEDDRSPPGH